MKKIFFSTHIRIVLKYTAILHIFFICKSCSSPEIKNIPVFSGLRLDYAINLSKFQEEDLLIKKYGLKGLVIELMVVGDSATGFPKISRTSLTQLSRILPMIIKDRTPLSLVLHHSHLKPLFFESNSLYSGYKLDTLKWFDKYQKEITDELLPRLKYDSSTNIQINRIIIGTYYSPLENCTSNWHSLFNHLKNHTEIPLSYATAVENVSKVKFWSSSSEIGVFYQSGTEENDKVYARKWNQYLSNFSKKIGKPIFITQANLIGNNKSNQFKNRIRFWENDVAVSGITLNNIFNQSALADTHHYFGLSGETQLLEYLLEKKKK